MSSTQTVNHTLDLCCDKCYTLQEQQQQHESARLALAAAEEAVQHLSSVKKQANAAQNELAVAKSAREALQAELAVAKARLSGFDESCQLSLDRVQSLSAALQEAQQAKVEPPHLLALLSLPLPSFFSYLFVYNACYLQHEWHPCHRTHLRYFLCQLQMPPPLSLPSPLPASCSLPT